MFIHNINPILLSLGIFQIRYYGLIFALGFIIAYFMLKNLTKKRNLKVDVDNLFVYLFVGIIIGARLFHIFNHFDDYGSFIEIFYIWNGGISFHGGLLGGIIALYYFTKKNNINFYDLADLLVIPGAIALSLGRFANFINGELPGTITNVPWSVKFQDFSGFRHPSQIYESLKNLFIFFILFNLKDLKLPRGYIFWTFITLYGLLRFTIEFFKDASLYNDVSFLGLSTGQYLTLPMFFIGLYFLSKYKLSEIR